MRGEEAEEVKVYDIWEKFESEKAIYQSVKLCRIEDPECEACQ